MTTITKGGPVVLPLPTEHTDLLVDEAQDIIEAGAWDGVGCPCCGSLLKIYRRKLHWEMCFFLVKLARSAPKREWRHLRDFIKSGPKASSDGSYLVHWGLVESGAKRAGMYRITPEGLAFAHGSIAVPEAIYIFDNNMLGFDAKHTTIREAIKDHFDYDSLMS